MAEELTENPRAFYVVAQIGEEIVGSQTYAFWKQLIESNLSAEGTIPA